MTAKTTREYMTKMKLRYARAKHRSERSALIDEAVTMTGFSRKYVIRLLCGSRVYKKHRGRAPTYSKDARDRLVKIWLAFGQMCSRYLHSIIEKAIADYQEARPNVYFSPEVIRELLQMSPSTMARILRPHQFQMRSANKRSGNKAMIAAGIPAAPGTLYEKKGAFVLQVDTVALCGGNMRESFFWILHVTEVETQWSMCAPVWNRGSEATCMALKHIFERLPFTPDVIHVDNGGEFINHHLLAFLKTYYPNVLFTRSRPYHKNDNHRIEQKNGSIIRTLFGDLRFDDFEQYQALTELCEQWSLLYNLCIPCTRQISKVRRVTSKGISYKRKTDDPLTPYQRLAQIIPLPPPPKYNAVKIRSQCERMLNRLFSTQHSARSMEKGRHAVPSP